MVFEYLLVFFAFIGSSWVIFYEIKKSERQKWWIDIAFFILIGLFSLVLSNLTHELWILYLLIPEAVLFISGLMKDMRKISTLTNFLIQIVTFTCVYFFINIGISNLKNPFIDKSISLGFLSLFVTLVWMFIITNSLATTGKVGGLLPGILLISSFVLLMTSSNVLGVSLFFTAFLGIFTVIFIQSMRSGNDVIVGTSIYQVLGFIFSVLAIKGASLSATSVVLFIPIGFFVMLALQKIYSFVKHDRKILTRTFLTPENIQSKLINLGFSKRSFVITSLILTLLISIFDIVFRHNPKLVSVAIYVIMAVLILSVLRLFIFIRDCKDGYKKGKGRIYVVNQYYHPDNAATGEITKDICEGLVSNGFDVVVLTSRTVKNSPKKETINGVFVDRLCDIPNGVGFTVKLRGYIKFFLFLTFRFLKVRRRSMILVMSTPPFVALIPILWKPFKEFKVVYNVQDLYPDIMSALKMFRDDSTIYKALHKIQSILFSKSDYIVAIGQSMKKRICSNYHIKDEKVAVIQNLPLKELRDFSKKGINISSNNFEKDAFVVQYSGNFGRSHEYQTILNAMRLVEKKGIKGLKFQFKGDGFNYKKLNAIVQKEKIKCAEFLPFVERKKLAESLSSANVSLVVSKKELSGIIFPSKFYGIISVGRPILYICDGDDDITDYVKRYKIGYVIPNGKSEELLERILMLKNSSNLLTNLSKNAFKLHEKLTYEYGSIDRYVKLFNEISPVTFEWHPITDFLTEVDVYK